jgi:hypothetical protein
MKKLMILLAVACLVFVSCKPKTEKAIETETTEETCCTLTPEQEEMFANWESWDGLDETQKIVLVGDMKAFLDECKAKCAEKCAEKEESAEEMCPVKKAKCEEMKAKWEAFETLTLEEQKALIDEFLACKKEKCCKEKEEGCKKHEHCSKE